MALPDCVSVVVSFAPLLRNAKRDITRLTGMILSRECVIWLSDFFLCSCDWVSALG